ncbi:YrdB family protein [Microbacterium sp.]|uniref:YrdB family protein n=1 Tax=Microbacterium sp. TaxID=51671 RepID=UPI0037CAB848
MPESSPVEPTPPPAPQPLPERPGPVTLVLYTVRFLVELFAFFTFAWWGFTSWPFAWNILAGVAAPAVAILVWALFVSPRAVIRVHPFVRAAVELIVFAAATVAWWTMGQVWIGLVFALFAVGSGVLVGRRRLS